MKLTVLNVAYPFAPVAPDTAGGAEQVLAMLDEALMAAGHRSLVLAPAGSRVVGELIASAPAQDWGLRGRGKLQSEYKQLLLEILRARRIDVVHFHGLDFSQYFPADVGESPAKFVATIHLPPGWHPPGTFQLPVDFVWVSSAQQTASGIGGGYVIPNGIRLDCFHPDGPREDYVVAMGRICPEKGYHHALDAANACGRRLILAGQVFPYSEHREYFETAIRPGLEPNHVFLGPVSGERKRRLLARAHCVVIPSQVQETSSLVAMEALACGTPVVAMRVGALPEIIEHGRTGWLVDKPEDLAEAIEAAAEIRPANCRAAAERRFSSERTTQSYLRLYERLASVTNSSDLGLASHPSEPRPAA